MARATPTMLATAAGTLCLAAILTAGPTNPPGGPVASTYRTLAEVQPRVPVQSLPGDATSLYVISQPGSYYLTGDIQGLAGKGGILVLVGNVTIDLQGFSIIGMDAATNAISVVSSPSITNIAIVNGTISGWGNFGVYAPNNNLRADRLSVTNCGRMPSGVGGGTGIYSAANAAITKCQAVGNGGYGVVTGARSVVTDCVASSNAATGISVGSGSKVSECESSTNGADGLASQDGAVFSHCSAFQNALAGFHTIGRSTIEGCAATNNQSGFEFGLATNLTACSASGNSGSGFFGDQEGGLLTGCTASGNGADGIRVQDRTTVTGCNATWNSSGSGIHAAGNANRIDGNSVNSNAIGIRADGNGNFIVRNTASYNPTRTQIAVDNDSAQWIVVPGPNFVSTDPWANFGH